MLSALHFHHAFTPIFARTIVSTIPTKLRHVTKISDLSCQEVDQIIGDAQKIKKKPRRYNAKLANKTLLMLFEKPSLRTRVSFEVGMEQLGGHGIFYDISTSPLGKKENMHDTAQCLSRFVDIVMARLNKRQDIQDLAKNSSIPIINGLDDYAHPCQMLADLLTMVEKKGSLKGKKLTYCGDIRNNVTYDLMRMACLCGFNISVAGPKGTEYDVEESVIHECKKLSNLPEGGNFEIHHDIADAVKDADIVYTDSWMSYHIDAQQLEKRKQDLLPFQVNKKAMSYAKPDAIFMNCLPANRELEQTAEVIDGPQSVVFDQAENRLHAQKSLLLWLLNVKV